MLREACRSDVIAAISSSIFSSVSAEDESLTAPLAGDSCPLEARVGAESPMGEELSSATTDCGAVADSAAGSTAASGSAENAAMSAEEDANAIRTVVPYNKYFGLSSYDQFGLAGLRADRVNGMCIGAGRVGPQL